MNPTARALALTLALAALAGCSGETLRQESGPRTLTFVLAPDPAVVSSERAPLESLSDARALLTDAANQSRFRALLAKMTGGRPVEVECVAATFSATETYLCRPPLDPAVAAVRVDPLPAKLTHRPDGSARLELAFTWGQAVRIADKVTEGHATEPLLINEPDDGPGQIDVVSVVWGDRARPFALALEEFIGRRAPGWNVAEVTYSERRRVPLADRTELERRHRERIDLEVNRGRERWPK